MFMILKKWKRQFEQFFSPKARLTINRNITARLVLKVDVSDDKQKLVNDDNETLETFTYDSSLDTKILQYIKQFIFKFIR